jgi:hypothetical protein
VKELPFQNRVYGWLIECFGKKISDDPIERNHRFLEESLELVQANGCTASEAHQLVDYVFGRPQGEANQEAGGVMVTLAALLLTIDVDMDVAAETELARINTPETIAKIRQKQATKIRYSVIPVAYDPFRPGHSTLAKLGAIAVHVEEMLSIGGHNVDRIAIGSLLEDPEVHDWLAAMEKTALLPLKRMA